MQFIFQTLKNDPAVNALLNGKIYPQVAPQDAAPPYATYTVVSTAPDRCKGETAQDSHRVQVSVFAEKYAELQSITQAVRNALDRKVTADARCDFENAVDLFESGDLLRHKAIDFQLITTR